MIDHKHVRVGVGVIIKDGQKVLLGKRKGSHGAGEWSLPGGHLEKWESFEDCCRREVKEETGLSIGAVHPTGFSNDQFPDDDKHYVTLFFTTYTYSGSLKLMEPDKCVAWRWFPVNDLPEPLFPPTKKALQR